jgi:outer membrane protein OmpA-like peptidoglycan-associated protein/tetratricopeptide (TPR) repeat protein
MVQKHFALISLLLFFFQYGFSQVEDEACLPPSKKILKMLDLARVAPDAQTAVGGFNEAIKENSDNAMVYYDFAMYAYNSGTKYLETLPNPSMGEKSYKKSEEMFIETLNHCADYNANCSYYLGVINYYQQEMSEAIKWFKVFKNFKHADPTRYPDDYAKKLDDVNSVIKELEEEIEMNSKKVPFDPKIVPNVSSANPEYFPMISPDNELMFFTRKVDLGGTGEIVRDKIQEQFSYSLRQNISTPFDKGKAFNKPFNDGTYQSYGAATMSVDNKEMIICACKNEMQSNGQNYLNCDLYRTEYERSGAGGNDFTWTPLENMGPGINTNNGWEGQPTLSADGNTMYYTCMRPTTRDNDIYVVERGADGKWGEAKPFDVINTDGKDKSPFLHQDSESLYFVSTSTETRKGAGGLDIFYIRKIDGVWSKPKNIGIPINSPEDELGIFVSTNGELAYYSSRTGGDWNIYSFELYEEARPSAVTIMKGTLNDENGKPIEGASIEVAYGNGSTEKSTVKVHGSDGKYAVVVKNPTKQDVMVTVKKEGYSFDSKLITKEEFAAQAAVAPNDVALAYKKETIKKEIDKVSKTQATPQKKTDLAVNTIKDKESTITKTNSKNSSISENTNSTNISSDQTTNSKPSSKNSSISENTNSTNAKSDQTTNSKSSSKNSSIYENTNSTNAKSDQTTNSKASSKNSTVLSNTTNVTSNETTNKKSESTIVSPKTTSVVNSDLVTAKKSIPSEPVDLEVQKILPQSTSKNTPVSMPKNDLVVKKLKVGVAYTINDILFETNSSELSDRSKFILKEFSSFLVDNPSSKIMIQGHTDDYGEDSENLKLSQERAQAVKDYLITLNIKTDRMSAKGFGELMPKYPNTNEMNRSKNRRTDFILEKL